MPTGDKIKRIREHQGLTQEQLAKMAGLCRQTISRIEEGYAPTNLTQLKIEKALGIQTQNKSLPMAPIKRHRGRPRLEENRRFFIESLASLKKGGHSNREIRNLVREISLCAKGYFPKGRMKITLDLSCVIKKWIIRGKASLRESTEWQSLISKFNNDHLKNKKVDDKTAIRNAIYRHEDIMVQQLRESDEFLKKVKETKFSAEDGLKMIHFFRMEAEAKVLEFQEYTVNPFFGDLLKAHGFPSSKPQKADLSPEAEAEAQAPSGL